jgi:hypothetical protein
MLEKGVFFIGEYVFDHELTNRKFNVEVGRKYNENIFIYFILLKQPTRTVHKIYRIT